MKRRIAIGLRAIAASLALLTLQVDEARAYNVVKQGSGHVLYHPDVILIFWGSYYADLSKPTNAAKVSGAMQQLASGAYFSYLHQYGNVGLPRFSSIWVETATDPCGGANRICGVSDSAVTNMINNRISAGTAPGPTAGSEQLYAVVLRPGVTFLSDHLGAWGVHLSGSSAGIPYFFLASLDSGSLTGWTQGSGTKIGPPTASLTHEIVEAMTDPDSQGYFDPNVVAGEIGDMCPTGTVGNSGYEVTSYWSQRSLNDQGVWDTSGAAAQQCVIPDGYNLLLQYNNSPNNWTWISPAAPLNQVAAGAWGLVATDTNNNVWRYNGTPGSWTLIGAPASMLAVDSNAVYATFPDLSLGVLRYTGGTNWAAIGGFPATLTAGGVGVFATDMGANNLYQWGGGTTWTGRGGPLSMVAVTSTTFIGLTPNHTYVVRDTSFSSIGPASSAVFAAYGTVVRTRPVGFTSNPPTEHDDVYAWTSGSSWVHQGWPGYMFAVAPQGLYGLTPDRTAVFKSTNLAVTDPPWTQVGGVATRLVGGGTTLYATQGVHLGLISNPN